MDEHSRATRTRHSTAALVLIGPDKPATLLPAGWLQAWNVRIAY
jgi:hypothetical protein